MKAAHTPGLTDAEISQLICDAAREANADFGQWMPTAWLQFFIKRFTPILRAAIAKAEGAQ